jgi:hypothetical protein
MLHVPLAGFLRLSHRWQKKDEKDLVSKRKSSGEGMQGEHDKNLTFLTIDLSTGSDRLASAEVHKRVDILFIIMNI